jgi:hypothetical protein
MKQRSEDGRDLIIEFHQIGDYVKVSAMDATTLTEVSIVGDPMAGEAELTRIAVRNLKYVLEKKTPLAGGRR